MKQYKHIGKLSNTGAKVLVVFRTLPGESDQALVLPVAQLPDSYHDALMQLVESDQAQESFELGEIMFTRRFTDGRTMLLALQQDNRLVKMPTSNVVMTPDTVNSVMLDQLNVLIAEQKNCTIDELYTFVSGAPKNYDASKAADPTPAATVEDIPVVDPDIPAPVRAQAKETEALSDKDIAKSYRSQADAMYKEAARLRREADQLDPPQKKTTSKETVSA